MLGEEEKEGFTKVRALSLLIAGAVIISTLTGCGKSSSDKAANEKKDDSYQKKIRVPGSKVYMKFFKTLGADPVAVSLERSVHSHPARHDRRAGERHLYYGIGEDG